VEDIAREWGVDSVIMVPDEFLAQNVAKQTPVKIVTWKGHCEVHERFTAADIRDFREGNPGVVVMAHPECPPEVIAEADLPVRPRACSTSSAPIGPSASCSSPNVR
jgi:quinolinate synthase